jgi:hypothetical protein
VQKVIDYRIKAIERANELVSQEVAYGLRTIYLVILKNKGAWIAQSV